MNFSKRIKSYLSKIDLKIFFLLVAFICFHLYLIFQTFYIDSIGNIRSTITGYGDIPLHLTQITKFAFEKSFNLNEPIFFGRNLDYPFLINFISGLIYRFTNSFSFSVLFPAFLFATLNIILIFLIYKLILKNDKLAFLSLITFFLGSGLGGIEYIKNAIDEKLNIFQFLNYLIQNHITTVVKLDAVYPSQSIDYGAPLSLVLLHQRAFFLGMFGLLIFLFFLILSEKSNKKLLLLISGVSLGLLPLMHTHSFIAACIIIFCFFIVATFRKKWDYLKKIIIVGIIGGLVSLPQVLYLLDLNTFGQSSSFFVFRLGWMVPSTIGSVTFPKNQMPTFFSFSFLQFLWLNLGIILPSFIIAVFILLSKKINIKTSDSIKVFSFTLAACFLFLIVQLVRFQPWDFDDNKILVYFQLFCIPIIFLVIKGIYEKRRYLGITLALFFMIFSLFSGVMDMIPRLATPLDSLPIIFDVNSQKVANYIRKNIPENDLILTGLSHRNPVDSLAGRPVLVGYPGWLWTRGIDYYSREEEVINFYQNPTINNSLINDYKIKYVLLSTQDISDMKVNQALFNLEFSIVYSNPEFTLYKL